MLHDVRFAVRVWRARPLLAAVIVLTLALGLSATSLIASVVHAVLLEPLPYARPDRLIVVRASLHGQNQPVAQLSGPEVVALMDRARTVEAGGAVWTRPGVLGGSDSAVEIEIGWITPGFLEAYGVSPQLGRLPSLDEHLRSDTIVLSDVLWRERFGSDPSIVGRRIEFDGEPRTVVGVMAPRFQMLFPPEDGVPDSIAAWLPWGEGLERLSRTFRVFTVVARLRPGVSDTERDGDLTSVGSTIAQETAEYARSGFSLRAASLAAALVAPVRPALLVILGVVGLVLAIACANAATLLLIRSMQRSPEFAMRLALGARRGRLWRQLLTEHLLLGSIAAAAGLWLADGGLALLRYLDPSGIPRLQNVSLDAPAVVLAALAALGVTMLIGIAASGHASRCPPRVHHLMRSGIGRPHPALRVFVLAQFALAVVLLAGAGLLVQTMVRINAVDLGFEPEGVVSMRVSLPDIRYPYTSAGPAIAEFYRQLDERLRQVPSVRAAGATVSPPLVGHPMRARAYAYRTREGEVQWGHAAADYRTVTPGWFEAMGVRLVTGRVLDSRDRVDRPLAVVVDTTLAARAWPGESALGKSIKVEVFRDGVFAPGWGEVVGVIIPVRQTSPLAQEREQVYLAHAQSPQRTMYACVLTDADPLAVVAQAQAIVRELESGLPVFDVRLATDYVAAATAVTRFAMVALGLFASVAIVLAGAGVFAAMSASVTERRREIAVRLALGASPSSVFRGVLTQGLAVALIGIGSGALAAVALTQVLSSLLFGVRPGDVPTIVAVAMLAAGCAVIGCWLPAARAAAVDPWETLRAE
ncbi:MAG TPA: ABC transporter permease [Vicinamibacterales bacterium]|nr:ABC transporter permease [Vicinamibacterales bacterium]